MTDERDRRRSQILSGVLELPISGFAFRARSSGTSIVRVRKQLLVNTVDRLLDEGVERWTLDGVEAVQRDRDRAHIGERLRSVKGKPLLYDHQVSTAEPLLWAADAVTWAIGAGGEYARRCAPTFRSIDILP